MKYTSGLDLKYYVEWGSCSWNRLTHLALRHLLDGKDDFSQKDLLELGPRSGKMSCLFALLEASVTALDIREESLSIAEQESQKHSVADKISFKSYNGDLSILEDDSFDLYFSKSVFFAIPDHYEVLSHLQRILKPGGRAVFIENGYGNGLIHWLRKFKHRHWDYSGAHFLTEESLKPFKEIFQIDHIERTLFPPIYCICATNTKTSSPT